MTPTGPDQLFGPAPNTLPTPQPPFAPEVIQPWIIAEDRARLDAMNSELANEYLTLIFPAWLNTYHLKAAAAGAPPNPPAGFMVSVSASDPYKISYVHAGPPVCAIPYYPQIPPPSTPGNVVVGIRLQGQGGPSNYWSVGDGDAYDGQAPVTATSQDGISGLFTKIRFPFGGWWLKIG